MAIPAIAMYEAWAAYDDVAVGPTFGWTLRRPVGERTPENRETAISYAMYEACLDQYPHHAAYLEEEMARLGFDPDDESLDPSTPAGASIVAEYCPDRL